MGLFKSLFVLHLRSLSAQAFKKREMAWAEPKNAAQLCQKVHHKSIEKEKMLERRNKEIKGEEKERSFFFFFMF